MKNFNILFLTNFDEASHQAIPAAAHIVSELQSTLTIMHIYEDASQKEDAERDIRSFFAEAEHYPGCRRFAIQGDLTSIVEQYCSDAGVDLLMVPSVRRFELQRLFRASTRARLLERVPAPLWTMTTQVKRKPSCGPIQRVGCYVDFANGNLSHLHAAVEMTRLLQAKLQLLCVTPTIAEDAMLKVLDRTPLISPTTAEKRLRHLIHSLSSDAEIHVAMGDELNETPHLARASKCDLLFLGEGHAATKSLAGHPKMRRFLSRLPCPAICFDGASRDGIRWALAPRHEVQRFTTRFALRLPASRVRQ